MSAGGPALAGRLYPLRAAISLSTGVSHSAFRIPQPVRAVAEARDMPVRWSCRTGACHNCGTGLISGSVIHRPDAREPLPRAICRSAAASLEVTWRSIVDAVDAAPQPAIIMAPPAAGEARRAGLRRDHHRRRPGRTIFGLPPSRRRDEGRYQVVNAGRPGLADPRLGDSTASSSVLA
jgi:ferredoxin